MHNPRISVIMPAYNHEAYIAAAIESVLRQSFTDLELIIINDGCTDSTEAVVKTYTDDRIQYYLQDNQGAPSAINRGISLASGEYISIINSDDVFHDQRLEIFYHAAIASGAKLLISHVQLVDAAEQPVTDPEHEWVRGYARMMGIYERTGSLLEALLDDNFSVSTSNFFFSKKIIEDIGSFGQYRYVHDYDFILRTLMRYGEGSVLFVSGKNLLKYRLHGSNTIAETRKNMAALLQERLLMLRQLASQQMTSGVPSQIPLIAMERIAMNLLRTNEKLLGLTNTVSWKITAPLRWVGRTLLRRRSDAGNGDGQR